MGSYFLFNYQPVKELMVINFIFLNTTTIFIKDSIELIVKSKKCITVVQMKQFQMK